jgi:O-6-methylguanine DNA methyltransferase
MPYCLFETRLGTCGVAWSDQGITWIQLPESDVEKTRRRVSTRAGADSEITARAAPAFVRDVVARVRQHLAGKPQDFSRVPLDPEKASDFGLRVYRALQAVPPGRTVTYGELAARVGSPGGARAVGRAMATNPFPVVVPCHRVLASSGKPGGFSAYGGLLTKQRILALEGTTLMLQTSLFDGDAPRLPYDAKEAQQHLSRADAKLARHIERVGPLRLSLKSTEDTFAALAESIVYQQLSGKAAATIFARVRGLFPGGRLHPRRALAIAESDLRAAGLSRGKLGSLRDLAFRATHGEIPSLEELSGMADDEVVERLTRVRGVGRWTVEMLLIFRLGRPDVLPLADYGIKKGFSKVFGPRRSEPTLPSEEEIARRGARWKPFRSVASWYLWRALDVTPNGP